MLRDWLSRSSATATPATPATHEGGRARSVATVAPVAVATRENPSPADDFEPYTRADPDGFDRLIRGREGELPALVERVAAHYCTPPDELAIMKRLALADPKAAWECFTADLATLESESARGSA